MPYRVMSLVVSVLVMSASMADLPPEKKKQLQNELSSIPAPELAGRVTTLVSESDEESREDIITAALEIIGYHRPTSVPSVVAALSNANARWSIIAARAGARIVPNQASEIQHAAIAAAPSQAIPIAQAVRVAHAAASSEYALESSANPGRGRDREVPKPGVRRGQTGNVPPGLQNPHPRRPPHAGPPPGRPKPRPIPYNRPPHPEHPEHPEHPDHPQRPNHPDHPRAR